MKRLLAIISIASGIANLGLCFSVLNTILALIQKDLHATTTELQWILNVYGIFIAPFLVLMGRLGDRFGYKHIFCLGLFFLVISSLGTAFSPSAMWVIMAQGFFGLAGAILLPLSQVLLFNCYPKEKASSAMALWTMAGGLTLAFGPIAAGLFSQIGTWRTVFVFMGIVAFISLIIAIFTIEEPERRDVKHLDLKGTFLLMLTIAVFVLAVMQTGTWKMSIVVALFFAAAILLVTLLTVERRVQNPIIREELFTHRPFLCAGIANALMIFTAWSVMFLVPLYLQTTLARSILTTGLIMLFLTIPMTVFSALCGKLYNCFGPRNMIALGFILMIASTLIEMFYSPTTPLWKIAIANACFGSAWAFVMVSSTTCAMANLDKGNAGTGAGTFNTLQEIGGVVGLTIVVTVVRLHSDFITGLHEGFLTLMFVAIIGLGFALSLEKRNRVRNAC